MSAWRDTQLIAPRTSLKPDRPALAIDLSYGADYPEAPERGYGEKVSRELPKLKLRVRFSLPAPV